jgi:methylase of polypeptide subunit release factors
MQISEVNIDEIDNLSYENCNAINYIIEFYRRWILGFHVVNFVDKRFLIFPFVHPGPNSFVHPILEKPEKFRISDDMSVCEMGCGAGGIALTLSNHVKKMTAIDKSSLAIYNTKLNMFLNKGKIGDIDVYRSNYFNDVPNEFFDMIIFNMPFFIDSDYKQTNACIKLKDLKRFITQSHKRLGNSGCLVIIASNLTNLSAFIDDIRNMYSIDNTYLINENVYTLPNMPKDEVISEELLYLFLKPK